MRREATEQAERAEGAGSDIVEVLLVWRSPQSSSVVAVRRVANGGVFAIGEQGDLVVPFESLGSLRAEIVRYERDVVTVLPPPGAVVRVGAEEVREADSIVLTRGDAVALVFGAFEVCVSRERADGQRFGAPLASLRESAAGYFAGSAAFHAAVFAAVALFCPPLGATEEDPLDRDRLALIEHLLNASAAREMERDASMGSSPTETGGATAPRAEGPEGAAGRPDAAHTANRAAHAWRADAADGMPLRAREIAAATAFGAITLLSEAFDGAAAAASPWDRAPASGAADSDAAGRLFGPAIGDAFGGGVGLSGPGEGGGGRAQAIGLSGLPSGEGGGGCLGSAPCGSGIGVGYGHPGRGHVPGFTGLRYARDVQVNGGHLPPEVIQRIVRQNDGRFRACYAGGLRQNPSLAGRVTVKFVVDRTGAVAVASDGGSDLPDEGVRRCVVSAFGALSFPAPESGMLTVSYPIVFNPE
jgi:hypothetical protein